MHFNCSIYSEYDERFLYTFMSIEYLRILLLNSFQRFITHLYAHRICRWVWKFRCRIKTVSLPHICCHFNSFNWHCYRHWMINERAGSYGIPGSVWPGVRWNCHVSVTGYCFTTREPTAQVFHLRFVRFAALFQLNL